jgi:hypothetical protein
MIKLGFVSFKGFAKVAEPLILPAPAGMTNELQAVTLGVLRKRLITC